MNRVFDAILAAPVGLELAPSGEEKTLLHAVTWEKRGTKRTTRARVEQLEVRGAFCFPFLARARADGVGTGAPACTDRPPPVGVPPHPAALKLGPWSYFWCCSCPQGVDLA